MRRDRPRSPRRPANRSIGTSRRAEELFEAHRLRVEGRRRHPIAPSCSPPRRADLRPAREGLLSLRRPVRSDVRRVPPVQLRRECQSLTRAVLRRQDGPPPSSTRPLRPGSASSTASASLIRGRAGVEHLGAGDGAAISGRSGAETADRAVGAEASPQAFVERPDRRASGNIPPRVGESPLALNSITKGAADDSVPLGFRWEGRRTGAEAARLRRHSAPSISTCRYLSSPARSSMRWPRAGATADALSPRQRRLRCRRTRSRHQPAPLSRWSLLTLCGWPVVIGRWPRPDRTRRSAGQSKPSLGWRGGDAWAARCVQRCAARPRRGHCACRIAARSRHGSCSCSGRRRPPVASHSRHIPPR